MGGRRSAEIGSMRGRAVLVTGATSGIGLATAAALGRAGATVLVHGRTRARAAAMVGELGPGAGGLVPVGADLGSLLGVADLAGQVREALPGGLHVLVNNAGAAFPTRMLSPDGVERTIAVNHLATAALTAALLDALRAGAAATGRRSRVINLSSRLERRGDPALQDWSYPDGFSQFQAYCDAKLLNLAYTYALAQRLSGSTITVNAADPGNVATNFGRNAGGIFKAFQVLGRPLLTTAEKGARTSLRLATDPALDAATGGYYRSAAPDASSARSQDTAFLADVYARTTAILHTGGLLDQAGEFVEDE